MDYGLISVLSILRQDAVGIILTLTMLSATMVTAEGLRHFLKPKVEWTRKFVHVCSGLVVACFPWLLTSAISVMVIAGLMFLVLALTKKLGWLQSVHSVSRKSYGDVYYLLAVVALFVISRNQPQYYFASILTLAIADAMAAVIGSTYHKVTFSVEANKKSLEGSTIFFLATFLTIHLPLLLLSEMPRELTVVIALQIAIVVTLIEAIAISGFDNFAIPLSVYFLLIKLDDKSTLFVSTQIAFQLLLILGLIIFCLRFRYFSLSAAIVNHLVLFAAFALGGPWWILPPILAMIVFARWRRRSDGKNPMRLVPNYQLLSALYVCFVPTSIIFINNFLLTFFHMQGRLFDEDVFYGLYAGAVSASASLSLVTLRKNFDKHGDRVGQQARILFCTSLFSFVMIVPISLALPGYGWSLSHWLAAFCFAFCAPLIHFIFWYRKHEHSISYLAFQALSLSACVVISSSVLLALTV